ncbi:hypothetical protein FBZ84_12657 [Azospirillum baldaniorum]|nr:hypothetical protein FBZ84_12657 [Azospirillum baldaniorum]
MTHDFNIYRDENGNSLVARDPFPCEYIVTPKSGDIERGIA